jgi:Rieske Fe-S protein
MCCTVSEIKKNVITCYCHGSQYSAATGDVISGPARRGLVAQGIEIFEGGIYLVTFREGTCDE